MKFVKDKSSIKYWILTGIFVLCIYSSQISKLFVPIFDNIYYGNLVKLFISLTSCLIWTIEFLVIFFVCKKLKIDLFGKNANNDKSENNLNDNSRLKSGENASENLKAESVIDGKKLEKNNHSKCGNLSHELTNWQVCALFVATVLPMLFISIYLNFKLKLVYSLGIRVTSVGLACNASEILSYLLRILFMVLIIRSVQQAMEINFKFNKTIFIPWGGIFLFLTVGLIDFFCFPVDLRLFYWLCTLWYGVIYLFSNKKFSVTYVLSYLIWLL